MASGRCEPNEFMKTIVLTTLLATCCALTTAQAQKGTLVFPPPPPNPPPAPPPPVYEVDPPPAPLPPGPGEPKVYVYDQKPVAGRQPLVSAEQGQAIIDRFKEAYPKLGHPRVLIFINRELIDEQSGMKLTHRKEHVEGTLNRSAGASQSSTVKSSSDNTYRVDPKIQASLADKQTMRDIERLFGRPLRSAGVSLTDQRVAAQLIADKPVEDFIGTSDNPQARKDREALLRIADVAIEVLIASKNVDVPTISASQQIAVPDIQATAIRLSDSKILGQAASSDVTGRVPAATLGSLSVQEVTEATAFALMEDMAGEVK